MTTRLLVAFDPWMLLTGDECVVALMGNHLLQGTLASGYFYGQHYGLSILEASCCALGLLAGGWHTAPIKISILLLFVPAVCLLMKTVTRLRDWRWGAAAGRHLYGGVPYAGSSRPNDVDCRVVGCFVRAGVASA